MAIVVVAVLPMIPGAVWSFYQGWYFPNLLPDELTFRGWVYLTKPYSHGFSSFVNSLIIATFATLISFPIGIPCARALGLYKFRGKRVVEFLVLAPLIMPDLPVAVGIHILFIKYGLASTLYGVMLVHIIIVMPYVILVRAGVFANYGPEAEESARTLGASPLKVFWYITLPGDPSGHDGGWAVCVSPVVEDVRLHAHHRWRGCGDASLGRLQLDGVGRQSSDGGHVDAAHCPGHCYSHVYGPLPDRRKGSGGILGDMTTTGSTGARRELQGQGDTIMTFHSRSRNR